MEEEAPALEALMEQQGLPAANCRPIGWLEARRQGPLIVVQ
jgi:hypothetical protein